MIFVVHVKDTSCLSTSSGIEKKMARKYEIKPAGYRRMCL
jgi:hypothetical protein